MYSRSYTIFNPNYEIFNLINSVKNIDMEVEYHENIKVKLTCVRLSSAKKDRLNMCSFYDLCERWVNEGFIVEIETICSDNNDIVYEIYDNGRIVDRLEFSTAGQDVSQLDNSLAYKYIKYKRQFFESQILSFANEVFPN